MSNINSESLHLSPTVKRHLSGTKMLLCMSNKRKPFKEINYVSTYLNVYLTDVLWSKFPAWQQCKSFPWHCRDKPQLFSHLYFISFTWVPSEPKPRSFTSISISIACLFIAKPFHHDTLPFFMQISNWLLVKCALQLLCIKEASLTFWN